MAILKKSLWEGGASHQYMAAVSGSFCYTIVGASTAWPSPTLIKMRNNEAPVTLDVEQISWMVSMMLLGHVSSPIISGYLMDTLGRKSTCIYLAVLPFASWILILFAKSAVELYLARYAAGLWIGVTSTIMPIYVGEIAETKLRSSLTTINNCLLNLGVVFAYVIGPYVTYSVLAISCEILTVVYVCLFITMPETPQYLVKHGQRERAVEVLTWLREGQPKEIIDNELLYIEKRIEDDKLKKGSSIKGILFNRGNRKAFVISVSYAVLKRLSGAGVLQAYASITLPKTTFAVLDQDACVIIIGFISLLSSIASAFLAVKFRRRTLLTISCAGCAITAAVVMVWFYLNANTSVNVVDYSWVIFASFSLYYTVFNIGLGPIGASIKGELFTGNVAGLSSSLTTLSVACTSFVMNKFYLIIADGVGMYVNYIAYSVSCVVAIILTWTYVPDTHNMTTEEIRTVLSGGLKEKRRNTSNV